MTGTLALVTIVVSSCGGGDDWQDEVAGMFIDLAESEGFQLDRECVEQATSQLSDGDAEKIVDAGFDGSADASDEAGANGAQILACLDVDSYRERIVADFESGDPSVDTDCLRAELDGSETVDEIDQRAIDEAIARGG